MQFILDMVHHNPGEPPFKSEFLNPAFLKTCGYNGQVFKHINCVATYESLGVDVFPEGSPDRAWLEGFLPSIEREIAAAKAQGLSVFYHLDLFVLPRRLVEHYKDRICDPQTGRIMLDAPMTLEIHRALFDELTRRFPQVDGYIIRVGETYLFDTPYHQGNGPIPRIGPAWTPTYLYDQVTGKAPREERWSQAQEDAYVWLIDFLREELCVKRSKYVMFRTWDIFPDKLHARLDHYLQVTDRIEPHSRLLFSIKHTALDFWRRVKVNECLTRGKHPQIIEVQCQREYEGKGAYPNYVMDGVINGFEENRMPVGLKELLGHPQIRGVYSWSRGGGWYGPYIKDEFWPELNAFVLARFACNPSAGEAEIFDRFARERIGLSHADMELFRELCLLSARAILKGRHCEAFDRVLEESVLPTANWMRDDRLGGFGQLAEVLDYLHEHNLLKQALSEKQEAVRLWEQVAALARSIRWPSGPRWECVKTSAEYGRLLFGIIHQGWRIMAAGLAGDRSGRYDTAELSDAIARYDLLWRDYRTLGKSPYAASPYKGEYFSLPGSPPVEGLDETVNRYRCKVQTS